MCHVGPDLGIYVRRNSLINALVLAVTKRRDAKVELELTNFTDGYTDVTYSYTIRREHGKHHSYPR